MIDRQSMLGVNKNRIQKVWYLIWTHLLDNRGQVDDPSQLRKLKDLLILENGLSVGYLHGGPITFGDDPHCGIAPRQPHFQSLACNQTETDLLLVIIIVTPESLSFQLNLQTGLKGKKYMHVDSKI